jgi:hypothetical protein
MTRPPKPRALFIEFPPGKTHWPMAALKGVMGEHTDVVSINPLAEALDSGGHRPIGAQAERWVQRVGDTPVPDVIVSYCTGAALACAISQRFTDSPLIVALAPLALASADIDEIGRELLRSAGLAGGLSEYGVDPRVPEEATHAMRDALQSEFARSAPDLEAQYLSQLVDLQVAWFSYALAASFTQPTRLDLVLTPARQSTPRLEHGKHQELAVALEDLALSPLTSSALDRWWREMREVD